MWNNTIIKLYLLGNSIAGTNRTCPCALSLFLTVPYEKRTEGAQLVALLRSHLHRNKPVQYFKCMGFFSCFFFGGEAPSRLPPHTTDLSCRRGERCEPHQARLSQLEPLIITSQYQLQQPCADAKTLGGLATLPYLIWAGGSETVPRHHAIQSEAEDGESGQSRR